MSGLTVNDFVQTRADLDEIDIADRCDKYKDFLEMFIIESGMPVAEDYPKVKHKDIVQRALHRKKPFKADGSTGYRDYLVWLTCLEAARRFPYALKQENRILGKSVV